MRNRTARLTAPRLKRTCAGHSLLQAAIASLHAETPCDWVQIGVLYGELARLTGSPVVELNRAIAIAESEGPEAGLRLLAELGLDDFPRHHAIKDASRRSRARGSQPR